MLRFLMVATALLLMTAPGFIASEVYVIDRFVADELKLEPLDDPSLPVLQVPKKTFSEGREGQIVSVLTIGYHIVSVQPVPHRTEDRQAQMSELLTKLTNDHLETY